MIVVNDVIGGFGAFVRPLFELIADEIEGGYRDRGP